MPGEIVHPIERAQQRSFARTRWSDEGTDLMLRKVEGHIANGYTAFEGHGDTAQSHYWFIGGRGLKCLLRGNVECRDRSHCISLRLLCCRRISHLFSLRSQAAPSRLPTLSTNTKRIRNRAVDRK